MGCGGDVDLWGLGLIVCPPDPMYPWSQHRNKTRDDSAAGQQGGEATTEEKLRRVSAGMQGSQEQHLQPQT